MKIKSVHLKNEVEIEFGDFNVIIGGNSVGKTTLLVELFSRIRMQDRSRWLWLDNKPPFFSSSDPISDLKLLTSSISRRWDGKHIYYFSQAVRTTDGNIDLDNKYRFDSSEYDKIQKIVSEADSESAQALLLQQKYQNPFVSFANCESRLNLPDRIAKTQLDQPPQDSLNVLFRNQSLRREIDRTINKQFGLKFALLDHTGTQLDLGLSKSEPPDFNHKSDDLQAEYLVVENWKEKNFINITDIGHGIRSMVKLLLILEDPVSEIILIDEPEMHIYPSQKRWIGKQLVVQARERGKQVFIVTHDPIILQGILDMPGSTRVFRIDIDDNKESRILKKCDLKHIDDVGAKRNQDSYLQGLFYQRSIAVEGAADRAFYQIMIEELFEKRIQDKDLGYIACGGIGASSNVVYISSKVGLRLAFIYDFDVLLFNMPILLSIVVKRGGITNRLLELDLFLDEHFGNDRKKIKQSSEKLHLKGFDSLFVQNNQLVFKRAIEELEKIGIFIVPWGSLESWAPEVEKKSRFAELAPEVIKGEYKLKGRLEIFLNDVLGYIGC